MRGFLMIERFPGEVPLHAVAEKRHKLATSFQKRAGQIWKLPDQLGETNIISMENSCTRTQVFKGIW
jgi:hypothetical protein